MNEFFNSELFMKKFEESGSEDSIAYKNFKIKYGEPDKCELKLFEVAGFYSGDYLIMAVYVCFNNKFSFHIDENFNVVGDSLSLHQKISKIHEEQNSIKEFSGDNEFLSNFYPSEIEYEGITYPTVEHAFQAAKTIYKDERIHISKLETPGRAKRAGRKVTLRNYWDNTKTSVMKELCLLKFAKKELKEKLLNTKDKTLIEGNNWGDDFWGIATRRGKNNLGKILMEVREFYSNQDQS